MNILCKYIGHKYRPRFDKLFPKNLTGIEGSLRQVEALKESHYKHDICERCGSVVVKELNQ